MVAAVHDGPPRRTFAQLGGEALREGGIAQRERLELFVVFRQLVERQLQRGVGCVQTRDHVAQVVEVLDVVAKGHRVADVCLFEPFQIGRQLGMVFVREGPVERLCRPDRRRSV